MIAPTAKTTAHKATIARNTRTPATNSRPAAERPARNDSPIVTSLARYRRPPAYTSAALCAASIRIARNTAMMTKTTTPAITSPTSCGLGLVVASRRNVVRFPAKTATARKMKARTNRRYQIAERAMKSKGFDL